MSATGDSSDASGMASTDGSDMKLEVLVIPVSDPDGNDYVVREQAGAELPL